VKLLAQNANVDDVTAADLQKPLDRPCFGHLLQSFVLIGCKVSTQTYKWLQACSV